MLTAVRAKRVLTMAEKRPSVPGSTSGADSLSFLEDTVLVAENGTITAVIPHADFRREYGTHITLTDLGDATIMPGLINCHSHLELAHLGGIAVSGQGFPAWVGSLLAHMGTPVTDTALDNALTEMAATGTVHVADVNGRAPRSVYEAALHHDVDVDLQMEVFGYGFSRPCTADDLWAPFLSGSAAELPDTVRKRHMLLAGHSLYSTRPDALVIAKQWCRSHERHFSVHLAEHADEEELLLTGRGRFRDMLGVRVLPQDYTAPGIRPVAYAAQLGLLDNTTLAVHCVRCTDNDIAILRDAGTTVCLCPRSNAFIGVGRAPVQAFMEAGVPLCLGTDSLASNHDLNLWNEARMLRDECSVPVAALLRMLTVHAAQILGQAQRLGTLEPGKLLRYAVLPADFAEQALP